MEIEIDGCKNSMIARALYKKSGYKEGCHVKDHYGPGRDLYAYYRDLSDVNYDKEQKINLLSEEINKKDKEELLELAKFIYTPDKFEEFSVCLDLYLDNKDKLGILTANSVLLRDEADKPESFAIYTDSIYENSTNVFWYGAKNNETIYKNKFIDTVCRKSKEEERDIVIINSDTEEIELSKQGFIQADNGIPKVFPKMMIHTYYCSLKI